MLKPRKKTSVLNCISSVRSPIWVLITALEFMLALIAIINVITTSHEQEW